MDRGTNQLQYNMASVIIAKYRGRTGGEAFGFPALQSLVEVEIV